MSKVIKVFVPYSEQYITYCEDCGEMLLKKEEELHMCKKPSRLSISLRGVIDIYNCITNTCKKVIVG